MWKVRPFARPPDPGDLSTERAIATLFLATHPHGTIEIAAIFSKHLCTRRVARILRFG